MNSNSALLLDSPKTAPAYSNREPPPMVALEPLLDEPSLADVATRVPRVLIVDDVAMNGEIAGYFLRGAGHRVVCVEGGAAAVEAVATTDFDLVLMDVRMREMDGLEATRRIRALGGGRGQIPIVALTAHAFTDQVTDCRRAGMNGHVAKPFDQDTLVDAVIRAIAAGPGGHIFGAEFMLVPVPVAFAIPTAGADIPIIAPMVFDSTVFALTPKAAALYLQTIVTLGEGLLRMLRRRPGVAPSMMELATAAHTLAASAGMFGFERLTAVARLFQHATESGTSEAPVLAEALTAAIRGSLHELRKRTAAIVDE